MHTYFLCNKSMPHHAMHAWKLDQTNAFLLSPASGFSYDRETKKAFGLLVAVLMFSWGSSSSSSPSLSLNVAIATLLDWHPQVQATGCYQYRLWFRAAVRFLDCNLTNQQQPCIYSINCQPCSLFLSVSLIVVLGKTCVAIGNIGFRFG